ncbi:hypothetical protein J5N97_016858 [Dioscorea zingiberensis]|uniref:ATP phosphoribosyltransferase n=1 Tax=Dioscorea zingiberensis TaxID=325984 RepID=A0A9D5CK88_9LILI|nr:hypothetical protein J5N97_016858 [Dioscorea zingiberensis]
MAAALELHAVVLHCCSSLSPPRRLPHRASVACSSTSALSPPIVFADGELEDLETRERTVARIGLPSKGRMAEETLELLKACQLTVKQVNPRQYVAYIPQLSNLEVWFQRPKDIVRKLKSGDLDLGIVGLDTVSEYGQGSEDLVLIHDELDFGHCHLSIAVPQYGIFENVNSMRELAQMPHWTEERPLRIATGFTYLGSKFTTANGLKHVSFSSADGALEAAPAMGIADGILDLVSSGTTLRENNLKEIEGGVVLESQGVLVGSKKALIQRDGMLEITHEILERLEAHLRAVGQFTVVANMRGNSEQEVAERILSHAELSGLQGPTISPVYREQDGKVSVDYYAIVICVPRKALYKSVQQLRALSGSGVLVSELTYIFEEETPRWRKLLSKLGL